MPNTKKTTIGQICSAQSSRFTEDSLINNNGQFPIFGAEGLIKTISTYDQESRYVALIKDGASVGKSFLLPAKSSIIGTLNYVLPKTNIDIDYLYQLFQTLNFRRFIVGSGIPHLYFKDFKQIEVTITETHEQQKIGSFLSALDRLIDLQKETIDSYKSLKKGYLQKMFPANGADVPEIRFKGFTDAWEQYKLSQLYDFSKGRGLSLDSFYEGNDSLGIAYGHLYTKYTEVINEVNLSTNDENGVLSRIGDLLFPGSSTVPFGTAQANALMLDNVQLGGDVIIARSKDFSVYAPFISYQINAQKSKLFPITVGTTITHMYGKDIANIEYKFPKLDEQQKIGRTLESLDSLITLHQRKLEHYEKLKSGYLQQLFAD